MKKQMKKIVASFVAAVMAVMLVAPAGVAFAKGSDYPGISTECVYRVTSVAKKTLRVIGVHKNSQNDKVITIGEDIKFGGTNGGSYKVTRISKNVMKVYGTKKTYATKATKVIVPSTVTKIDAGAFNKSNVKTLVIKSTKLTKKNVKNMFKGAKAKKIVVKVPKSKLKAYKKIFTKKNTGAKGTVVVKA